MVTGTPWRDPRTGLVVHRPLQRKTRLRVRSAARAREMRLYAVEAAAFIAEHPFCEHPTNHPDAPVPATVVHHKRGRFGKRLRDKRWWARSCDPCNDEAETNTGKALADGWLIRIEGVQ